MSQTPNQVNPQLKEIELHAKNGMGILILNLLLMLAALAGFILSIVILASETSLAAGVLLLIVSSLYLFLVGPILFGGLKVLKPNEALVLTLFGRYHAPSKGQDFSLSTPSVLQSTRRPG